MNYLHSGVCGLGSSFATEASVNVIQIVDKPYSKSAKLIFKEYLIIMIVVVVSAILVALRFAFCISEDRILVRNIP